MPGPDLNHLYEVANPIDKALPGMGQAASTTAAMTKNQTQTTKVDKGAGGALISGAGGALAGAELAPLLGASGPAGAIAGGVLGLASYFF